MDHGLLFSNIYGKICNHQTCAQYVSTSRSRTKSVLHRKGVQMTWWRETGKRYTLTWWHMVNVFTEIHDIYIYIKVLNSIVHEGDGFTRYTFLRCLLEQPKLQVCYRLLVSFAPDRIQPWWWSDPEVCWSVECGISATFETRFRGHEPHVWAEVPVTWEVLMVRKLTHWSNMATAIKVLPNRGTQTDRARKCPLTMFLKVKRREAVSLLVADFGWAKWH